MEGIVLRSEIIKLVEEFNNSIKEALNEKKISNTGEAARSLRVEITQEEIISYGIFYLEFLDTGRGGGNRPPRDAIQRWVEEKLGLSGEEAERVAILIANKIAKVGTEIFINNKKGIQLTEKVNKLRDDVTNITNEIAREQIVQELNKYKKLYEMKL